MPTAIDHHALLRPVLHLLNRSYGKNWNVFKTRMRDFVLPKKDVVVYGCGARSSTLINFLELDNILCYIDDQEEKQGYFVPGSQLEISPWHDGLQDSFFLLGVNTENEMKVIQNRGLHSTQFLSIQPPSRFLPIFWKDMINV